MKEKTKVKKMYILDGGSFLYGRGMMQLGMDLDKRQRIIVPFFAFDTEEGWVLYDTGFSPETIPRLDSLGLTQKQLYIFASHLQVIFGRASIAKSSK